MHSASMNVSNETRNHFFLFLFISKIADCCTKSLVHLVEIFSKQNMLPFGDAGHSVAELPTMGKVSGMKWKWKVCTQDAKQNQISFLNY